MKLKLKFMAFVLIALLTILGSSQWGIANPSSEISEAVRPCIPETVWRYRIGRVEELAQTRYQGVDYYLFHLYPENSQPFEPEELRFPHIVSVQSQSCEVAYSNPSNDEKWMSDSVPEPVANQFTLARYRFFIATVGLDEFKQRYLPTYRQSDAPEVQWALEQLGLAAGSHSSMP
jgi:hypothetical protein